MENTENTLSIIREALQAYDEYKIMMSKKILEILKADCKTYAELEEKFYLIKKYLFFEVDGEEKYEHLFNEIRVQLDKEKNALPLTKH